MFDSLRQAFREAVDNFRTELNRDDVPESADRLLRAMGEEVVRARAHLARLEKEVAGVRDEAKREEAEARTCLRREEMALRIGDDETVKVAREYAARHLRRKDLLDQKAAVLERELEDRRREADEMMARLKEARVERESLTASAGRTGARRSLHEADELFHAMDRMAERIDDLEGRAAAAREIDDLGLDGGAAGTAPPPPAPDDVDARLAELKRRMGQE